DPYQHYPEAYESRYSTAQLQVQQSPLQQAQTYEPQEHYQQQHQYYQQDQQPLQHQQPPQHQQPQPPAPRGMFEPRVAPVPPAQDDDQQWHSPGEPR
ncbi:poly-gamma-glutamate synthase PgsB, partial [Streptomyces sp. NPDC059900]